MAKLEGAGQWGLQNSVLLLANPDFQTYLFVQTILEWRLLNQKKMYSV
jgi:hypothetical protein